MHLLRGPMVSMVVLSGLLCEPAVAQTADAAPQPTVAAAQQASGADAKAADNGGLADIVVTAQKRSESLQRAPAAITVVSGAEVATRGVLDLRRLESFVPSTKTNVEATSTQVFIRGVGKQVDQNKVPDAVGTQMDGIYIPQHATALGLYDLASIEVLPGPQGTLYGTGSIGGVVNIKSNRPTKDFEASALAEYGNYDFRHLTAVVNAPLGADVSVRGAFNGSYHDGYNNNGTYDDHATSARLSLLYAPTESALSIFVTGSYFYDVYHQSPAQYSPYPSTGAYNFPAFDPAYAFIYPPNGASNNPGKSRQRIVAVYGEVTYDLGGATLSYIPGYLRQTNPDNGPNENVSTIGGIVISQHTTINQYSNELRLTSNGGGPIKWLAGLYQLHSKDHQDFTFGPNLGGVDNNDRWSSLALFGQLTYSVSDALRLTGGARLSRDVLRSVNSAAIFPILPTFARGEQRFDFKGVWKKANWKAGAEFDVAPHSLLYGTVQTGFNPGTYDGNLPNPARAVRPQRMTGFTVGMKNTLLHGQLRLNAEGFLYKYRDQIIQANDVSTGFTRLYNAPRSRSWGVQVDAAYSLGAHTKLYSSVGYLNAEFKTFATALPGGLVQDFAGFQLPFSPSWTVAAGAGHTFELVGSGSIEARADTYISSSYWGSFSHTSNLYQKSFTKTDVSVTYTTEDERFQLGVWARNLENEAVMAAGGETGRPYPFAGAVYTGPPRTYGVRLAAKFH